MAAIETPPTECPNCGGTDFALFSNVKGPSYVVDGRIKMNEVRAEVVLGCNECSETLCVWAANDFLFEMEGKILDLLHRKAVLMNG